MVRLFFVESDLRRWVRESAAFLNQIAEGSGGRLTLESILDAIASNHYRLALVLDEEVRAAIVWQPIHWKTGLKEFEIIGLTGEGMKEWLHLDDELKRIVIDEMGFDVIRPVARPGWSRLMKSKGYVTTHVIMEYRK